MNLRETIDFKQRMIYAGGPGSGRKPGWGNKPHAVLDKLSPERRKLALQIASDSRASELRDYLSQAHTGGLNGERLYDHMDKKFGVGTWQHNNPEATQHMLKITSTPGGLRRFSSFKGY